MLRPMHSQARALRGACLELRHPRLWMPAAALLLPTLALQLAFPGWLRTRLSPSMWTVVAGSLLIVFLTQIAAAASWGWVDATRRGRRPRHRGLVRSAMRVGSLTTMGMLLGVLPGLWLQARLAHVPLQGAGHEVAAASRRRRWSLAGLSALTLLVSVLGQSLAAGLAEALGTIVPGAVVDGRVQFRLHYAPHLVTSVIAYAWTVLALTLQAIGVSRLHEPAAVVATTRTTVAPAAHRLPMRAAVVGATLVLLAGAVAAVHKVQQHLY